MWYAVIAVGLGVAIGLGRGGRFTDLATKSFHAAPLFAVGVALQIVTELFHLPKAFDFTLVVASYLSLAGFAWRNLHLAGMGVFAVGLALNVLPIVVNQGMPVRPSAIAQAGIVQHAADASRLRFGGKRHLERGGDHLIVLSDVVPDRVFHEVLSFGDLVMATGIAAVLANLLRPAARHSTRPDAVETSA